MVARVPQSVLWLAALAATFAAFSWGLAPSTGTPDQQRCGGQRFTLRTISGGSSPYVTLVADGRKGSFLVDYGATYSTLSAKRFSPGQIGQSIGVTSFSLPSFPSGQFKLVEYFNARAPSGGQLGVIGTDFLSRLTADFVFEGRGRAVFFDAKPCAPAILKSRALVPVKQTGFFTSNPSRLAAGRANVPVIFLRFGSVVTWAQIDSGYDDIQLPPSVDINEALYRQLLATGLRLERQPDIVVSTCAGREAREVYRFAGVVLQSETGRPILKLDRVNLIRKRRNVCGGITSLTEPAAQIGASILARIGEVVFDPSTETVWMKGGR